MIFEHFALNVPQPAAQAQWYVQHLGFKIVRRREDAPFTHFLADETGCDHIVTLDERGFRTFRFRSTRRFQLVLPPP